MPRRFNSFIAGGLFLIPVTIPTQTITEIVLPGTRVFPESITSTTDGTLIVGSLGHGNVLRITPGKPAEEWIKPGAGGLNAVLGVYADEPANTLWVCSNNLDKKGEATALKAFDLKTGAFKATYPVPGGAASLCNDIAVAGDGTAYVSDTRQGAIFLLKRDGKALELAAKDPLIGGADGLAFGDQTVLYVNSISTGKLLRVELGPDGKAKAVSDLKLSQRLSSPDGMRAIGKNRLLLAENAGKMDIITIEGQNAVVKTIKSGLDGTTAVTATRGMAWIVEGKLEYRDDPKKDPGTFKMYAMPIPKS